MSNYDWLHEAEDVSLVAGGVRQCSDLRPLLLSLGFMLDDDIFVVDREATPSFPPWQSRSVVSVFVLFGGEEIYDEGQWDSLRLRYLLATLPSSLIPVFVEKASAVAEVLGIPMLYRGRPLNPEELIDELESCARELRERVGEPGTKEVAITIKQTYPRR